MTSVPAYVQHLLISATLTTLTWPQVLVSPPRSVFVLMELCSGLLLDALHRSTWKDRFTTINDSRLINGKIEAIVVPIEVLRR